jgi:hypothetical protein
MHFTASFHIFLYDSDPIPHASFHQHHEIKPERFAYLHSLSRSSSDPDNAALSSLSMNFFFVSHPVKTPLFTQPHPNWECKYTTN